MNQPLRLLIGVDAGGTGTTAWIASLDELSSRPLGVGEAGPGNPRAVGFESAQREIHTAITLAFESSGMARGTAAGLCLSAAGAGRVSEQAILREWAESLRFADRILVTGDAEPILAAASDDHTGIALICGTGSLAWGRNHAGHVDRTGGWGPLFGDEGSAYVIALNGLRAAARASDGRGPSTGLLDAFQQRLDAATPSTLIERIYGAALSRQQIASLADIVFTVAGNDEVSRQIVANAAADLAEMVTSLASKLNLPTQMFALAMTGGVLLHQQAFRAAITERVGIDVRQTTLVPEPVAGAIKLARRLALA